MTRKELQEQINKLQEQLNAMHEDESYYLMLDGAIAATPIGDIFNILPDDNSDGFDEKHGLGKYKTKEWAERARVSILCLLHRLKDMEKYSDKFLKDDDFNFYVSTAQGKEIIKQIEDGTYE